jgi:hypothetical protein
VHDHRKGFVLRSPTQNQTSFLAQQNQTVIGESGIAPEQRTENAEPRPQPPGDARLAQPEPYFGKANRKVYPSWCHSPGEKHLNKLEKP